VTPIVPEKESGIEELLWPTAPHRFINLVLEGCDCFFVNRLGLLVRREHRHTRRKTDSATRAQALQVAESLGVAPCNDSDQREDETMVNQKKRMMGARSDSVARPNILLKVTHHTSGAADMVVRASVAQVLNTYSHQRCVVST
jgi:hypothetical protein